MTDILKIAEQMRNHALELIESITSQQTTKPSTFEAHGKTWTRHTPGDPMPCHGTSKVDILLRNQDIGAATNAFANSVNWSTIPLEQVQIIGWRYADEEKQKFSEPWAKEKEAHAAGKVIQYFSDKAGRWVNIKEPMWYASDEYRVKPKPKLVPLGPEDVPLFSGLRYIDQPSNEYGVTAKVAGEIKSYVMTWDFAALMGRMEINRSIPLTGKWDANAWEPCHKEAAE